MSLRGVELDYSVQGFGRYKSRQQTQSISEAGAIDRFTSLAGELSSFPENQNQSVMIAAGKLLVAQIHITSNSQTSGAGMTIKLRKNEADLAPSRQFDVPALSTVDFEIVLDVDFVKGDIFGWEIITTGTGGSFKFTVSTLMEIDA